MYLVVESVSGHIHDDVLVMERKSDYQVYLMAPNIA